MVAGNFIISAYVSTISIFFAFTNSTVKQTSTCDLYIGANIFMYDADDADNNYGDGPGSIYASFLLYPRDAIVDADRRRWNLYEETPIESLFCSISVLASDYENSLWKCQTLEISEVDDKVTMKKLSVIPSFG